MDFLKRIQLPFAAFLLLVVAVVLGAGACGFDPQIGDGAFACAADRSCPNGFVCAGDNKCYRPGNGPPVTTVDGGGDADTGAPFVPSKLQADPIALAEGNGGTTDFVFTVRLDPPSTREVTVDYATNDGTAKTSEDFASAAGKLIFPPGSTSQTVTVKVTADRFEEPDETFTLKLTNPVNGVFLAGAGPDVTATIKNDDSPGLAIDDVSITEADQDIDASFIVSLSGTYTADVTVQYAAIPGTAKESTDYVASSGTLTFAPGEKTKTIAVAIKGDVAHEPEESFTVKLTNPAGAPMVDDEATGKIIDNDPIPTITIADSTVAEGDSGTTNMTFPVTLSAASGEEVKVSFTTGGGTASGNDYATTTGTLTFAPGETTQNVTVPINGDVTDEADENFIVTLSVPVNATIAKATANGLITDDDLPPILIIQDVALAEGNAGTTTTFPFVFTLSAASGKGVSITYTTTSGTATAGSDFTASTAVVAFAAGETTKTVNIAVTGDDTAEPTESFTLALSGAANVTPPAAAPMGTIINDDGAAATFTVSDAVAVTEGNAGTTTLTFTVTCNSANPFAGASVDFTTADGTATAGSDYVAKSGTLNAFGNCQGMTQVVTVTVNGDTTHEPDETVFVQLSNPVANSAITDAQGSGTISNDDGLPSVTISPVTAPEGNVSALPFGFDVILSNPSSTTITVNYATGPGASNPATAGSDYVTTSGTLSFAPGETTKTINVTVNGDVVYEQNETFNVTLSSPSANATIAGGGVGVGTITNDDTKPQISVNDVTLGEGSSGTTNFVFTVSLTGPTDVPVTVNYSTSDGTAIAGTDYTAKTGTATIPAGETSTTFTVVVTADTLFEPNETFTVTLSTPTPVDYVIADATGLATITNDDQSRLLSINDPLSVVEGNNITFTISLPQGSNGATSVTWTLVDVTTTAADHQATLTGTVSFTNNQTSKTIVIATTNDSLDELDETFNIVLSNVVGDAQIFDGTGVGTITDNDATPSITITQTVSEKEGDSGTSLMTFNVTLSTASGQVVTVDFATQDVTAQGSGGVSSRDYEAQSGTLTWNPGDALTKTISVVIRGDTRSESDETFKVNLTNPVGATISGGAFGTGTITDDD